MFLGLEDQHKLHCEGPDFVHEEAQAENARIGPGLVVSLKGQLSHPHCCQCPEMAVRQKYLGLLEPVIFHCPGCQQLALIPQAEKIADRPHPPTHGVQEGLGRGRQDGRRGRVHRRRHERDGAVQQVYSDRGQVC